ncbi:repetitive organellar protein-like [Palaemon carinicauda]|uniref:repetitive organellar protein-like n=1 Tax=Palaemon carinicauda TaxID=392227 RepID=UPI0035B5811F
MIPISCGILTTLLLISSSVQGEQGQWNSSPHVHHLMGKARHHSRNETADLIMSRLEFSIKGISGSLFHNSRPHLSCNDNAGLFPIPGSRTDFYLCGNKENSSTNEPIFTYSCPHGMTFDAEISICVFSPSAVSITDAKKILNTLVQEASEEEPLLIFKAKGDSSSLKSKRLGKFAGIPTLVCRETANNIISEANIIHAQISHIDHYIAHLQIIEPQELLSLQQRNYLKILEEYNMDLQIAKSNVKMWRNQNGVFDAMKEVLLLAKNFEAKFINRFTVFMQKVGGILNGKKKLTISSREIWFDTEANITELRTLLSPNPDELIRLEYLRNDFSELRKVYEEFSIKNEIQKILGFLEFVRNDVEELMLKVVESESKTFSFEEKIREDYGKFKRHINVVQVATEMLQKDKIENERVKEALEREKIIFSKRRETAKGNLANVQQRKMEADRKLNSLRHQRSKRAVPPAIPVIGGVMVVGWILNNLFGNNNNYARQLQRRISSYQQSIAILEQEIKLIEQDITVYDMRLHASERKAEILQDEVLELTEFHRIFKAIENQLQFVESLLMNAKKGILLVKEIFQDLSFHLEQLISEAMEAKSAVEQREFMHFLYNDIGIMKCLWGEVSNRLSLLDGFQ